MEHRFEIDGQTYTINPSEDIKIDRTNIDLEFITIAKTYHLYAELEAMADSNRRVLETQRDVLYAQLDEEKRSQALSSGTLKVTEKMVENMVITDKRYVAKVAELNKSDRITRILRAARDSIAVKRDALISLGAHLRQSNANLTVNR